VNTVIRQTIGTLGMCAALAACGGDGGEDPTTTLTSTTPTNPSSGPSSDPSNASAPTTSGSTSDASTSTGIGGESSSSSSSEGGGPLFDVGSGETGVEPPECEATGTCNQLDILFIIDNSGSMGEEQKNLAANFPYLIQKIRGLKDGEGKDINADVNIMVTTSDFGHPLCTPFYKDGYMPAKGAPISTACTDRLERFTGVGDPVIQIPEACTDGCSPASAAAPMGPFIHFNPMSSNVLDPDGMGDPVADALACIGPQGIDGCGMEATLETMLQALDPNKPWNMGDEPFLRQGALLAIVVVTDEEDCAVKDYGYFDPSNADDPMYTQYWEIEPTMGKYYQPTSAVCWNAGTDCPDADMNGQYECVSADKGVLQPLTRYKGYLQDVLIGQKNKQVVMLGILGVPPVTAHNPEPPYEPVSGGVFDLVYRDWLPADILPGDPKTPAQKQYEFGIGPGCSNAATGQAIPPVRIKEVCESLNVADDPNTPSNEEKLRCCIESICDDDFSDAIDCLSGILQDELLPPG
jgi:hypothetical protein